MKKLEAVFLLSFLLFFSLNAQEKSTKQYETISWSTVEKSIKYEVNVEKLDDKNKWEKVYSKQTKKTSLEVLLEPGSYRVAITTFNILGKKIVSDWTSFYILNEDTPYLFNNYYEQNSEWKVPVLFLNFKEENSEAAEKLRGVIKSEKGFAENSFFVKGKNIFSQNTSFSLVPSDSPLNGGKNYPPFYTTRKEVPLSIIQRDTKKNGVYVSYNPDLLFSGYYSLVVKNGAKQASYGILVIADRPLEMKPDEGFIQDARYKVNAFEIKNSKEVKFSVTGKGFTNSTKFSLIPVDNVGIEYPYASTLKRNIVPINLRDKTDINTAGAQKLDFVCNASELKTGYYYIQAENDSNEVVKCLILAKLPVDDNTSVEIDKISTKFNKRTENVDFTVTGKNLNANSSISLISAYSSETEGNSHIQLENVKTVSGGTKLYGSASSGDVNFGNHAIVMESKKGSSIAYFNVDHHYKSHLVKMTAEKAESVFLRPEGNKNLINFNSSIQEKVSFYDEVEVSWVRPSLFPYLRVTVWPDIIDINEYETNMDVNLELDVFNYRDIFYVDAGLHFNPHFQMWDEMAPELGVELFARLAAPGYYINPFIGLGVGYNLIDSNIGFNLFPFITSVPTRTSIANDGFLNSTDIYFSAQAGLLLLQFFDVRYSFELHNLLNSNEEKSFEHVFTLGARIPLRRLNFVRDVVSQGVKITKSGEVQGTEYTNIEKVTSIDFDQGTTEIYGFENHSKVESVKVSDTVEIIGDEAFKNCSSLSKVSLPIGSKSLQVIGEGAFADDKQVERIRIPASVREIKEDAFKNWSDGQTIILDWKKEDNGSRNLAGLDGNNALILYSDGSEYKENRAYPSPFMNPKNFNTSLSGIRYSFSSLSQNSKLHGTLHISGSRKKVDGRTLTKGTSSEVLNEVKSAKSIKFKVYGDGNSYMFFVGTSDGSFFATKFKTKSHRISTVKISMNSLKKCAYSNSNKLDKNRITFAQIIPDLDSDNYSEAYFFDFEVEKK